jgi:hypothetical protein
MDYKNLNVNAREISFNQENKIKFRVVSRKLPLINLQRKQHTSP